MAKIYEEISWNPHLTQECHFCKTILKYNFPFLINACLKKQHHYFPICKVRAKDVNDIPFGCHNLHRFDKRSAFVNIVRLSLKSIFWIFFLCKYMYHGGKGLRCLNLRMPKVPAQISLMIANHFSSCGTKWVIKASLAFLKILQIQDVLSIPSKVFSMLFERPVRRFVYIIHTFVLLRFLRKKRTEHNFSNCDLKILFKLL